MLQEAALWKVLLHMEGIIYNTKEHKHFSMMVFLKKLWNNQYERSSYLWNEFFWNNRCRDYWLGLTTQQSRSSVTSCSNNSCLPPRISSSGWWSTWGSSSTPSNTWAPPTSKEFYFKRWHISAFELFKDLYLHSIVIYSTYMTFMTQFV